MDKKLIVVEQETIKYKYHFQTKTFNIPELFKGNFIGKFEAIVSCFISVISEELDCLTEQFNVKFNSHIQNILSRILKSKSSRITLGREETVCFENCEFCGLSNNKNNSKNNIITNADAILSRLKYSLETSADNDLSQIISQLQGYTICVGTGGSFAAAVYASHVVSELTNNVSVALKPYEVFFIKPQLIHNIILFSYSGTTQDIIEVIEYFKVHNIKIYLVTKMYPELIIDKLTSNHITIVSYGSEETYYSWEKGFISMSGTICPATLFAKIACPQYSKNDFIRIIEEQWEHWNKYFKDAFVSISKPRKNFNVEVFYAFDCKSAAMDIESKFIESGFGRILLPDKKDFSHGRFNIIKYCKPNIILYFANARSKYDQQLIEYLSNTDIPIKMKR